jgi:hypothetical protein
VAESLQLWICTKGGVEPEPNIHKTGLGYMRMIWFWDDLTKVCLRLCCKESDGDLGNILIRYIFPDEISLASILH